MIRSWRRSALLVLLVVVLLATGSCGGGGSGATSRTAERMVPLMERMMAEDQVTGAAIVLVDDQKVVWARGFGYADAARRIPATAETLFEIGSNSKTMVASMVMQLVEEGRLRRDTPLTTILPRFSIGAPLGSFPSPRGSVTVEQMMNHHAGLPGDLFNGAFTSQVAYGDFNSRLLAYLAGEYADYPPGFLLAYSNTAVSLLSEVVEAASGQTFRERSQAFFHTLGMDHSSFYRDSASLPPNQSKGYLLGQEYGPFFCNIPAAGSVLSSASDMGKYLKMVLAGGMGERGRVLREETLEALLTRTNGDVGLDGDVGIGLGWFVSDPEMDYAGRLCWHNGSTILMASHMEILRDHKLGVIVMTNSMTGGRVAAEGARRTLQLALEEKRGICPPPSPTPDPSPVVTWTDEALDGVAGIYVTTSGYDRIVRVPGGLEWIVDAGRTSSDASVRRDRCGLGEDPARRRATEGKAGTVQRLVPRANGWFSSPDSQERQIEFKDLGGRRVMMAHLGTFSGLLGERYVPPGIPQAWTARLGTYDLTNGDPHDASRELPEAYRFVSARMTLKVRDGLLLMEFPEGIWSGNQYVVRPLSDRLGYLAGLGRNLGGSVQVLSPGAGEKVQVLGLQYTRR